MNNVRSFLAPPVTPLRERMGVIALVLSVHLLAGAAWLVPQEKAREIKVSEISVSLAMQPPEKPERPQAEPPKPEPQRPKAEPQRPKAEPQRPRIERAPAVQAPSAPQVAMPAAVPFVAAAADNEPDYKAGYLHNPRPNYPMVARRMGWEGRVILNVEVLAEGSCGAVVVYRSSGHEVLDNAAMNTVKTWRFTPARHIGNAVTQWFKVPVNFSLEDNEA